MMRIVEGAPEERRRYLNLAMEQVIPRFAFQVNEYGRACHSGMHYLNRSMSAAESRTSWIIG